MMFAKTHWFFSSARATSTPKPMSVALPGPVVRPDTPALRAWALNLRGLAGRAGTPIEPRPVPSGQWSETLPASFGLLVHGRRADD